MRGRTPRGADRVCPPVVADAASSDTLVAVESAGPSIIAQLIASGPLGVLAAALLFLLWMKDKELREERQARIADAKAQHEAMLALQRDTLHGIETLGTVMKALPQTRPAYRSGG